MFDGLAGLHSRLTRYSKSGVRLRVDGSLDNGADGRAHGRVKR